MLTIVHLIIDVGYCVFAFLRLMRYSVIAFNSLIINNFKKIPTNIDVQKNISAKPARFKTKIYFSEGL
jgi:hypothetical protein